ncbi:MAG: response regulator transcription factor [Myxococcales bacterium]|nr:response regulator transcription factor [Myxococcales bacterium]
MDRPTQRILLVEDDPELGAQVVADLRRAGYEVDWQTRGTSQHEDLGATYALVILDLMLPGLHGLDMLKQLRVHSDLPVLVLSARNETPDKVRALQLGADDYMTKPFWPDELLERVRARLRRPVLARAGRLEVGRLVLELGARKVWLDGREIDVTRVEFALLSLLAKRPGEAFSRAALVAQALDPERDGTERTLDVHVSRLRKKLGGGDMIATVWGIGYRLEER